MGDLRIWALSDSVTILGDARPEAENEVYREADGTIRLDAAINEVTSFQLALVSMGSSVNIKGVTVADLRQGEWVIPAEQVWLYRQGLVSADEFPVWYLRLTPYLGRPKKIPDPLIPLTAPGGALPIGLEPGQCQGLWVDICVPLGTHPGLYRSTLRVVTGGGGERRLKLLVNVWPFALPQTRHLAVLAGVETAKLFRCGLEVDGEPYAPVRLSFDDPAYQRAANFLDQTWQLLHQHRCSPILSDVYPIRRVGVGGQIELDWVDYDRMVSGLLDGTAFEDRQAVRAWPLPVSGRVPSPEAYKGWGSSEYEDVLADYLRQCVEHFDKKGWLDRHFLRIELPGRSRGRQYRQFRRLGELVRKTDKRINLLCHLACQSMGPYGYLEDPFEDVSDMVGIWCPPASLADHGELASQRAGGKGCWLWPDRPPFAGSLSLLAPPDHALCIGWHAYRFGYEAVWLAEINDWRNDGAVVSKGSERSLIWPGRPFGLDRPVPSIRLKRLRRGLQDYEYLWLLEQNRRPGIARLIAADLIAYAGTGCYGDNFLDGKPGGWMTDKGSWSLVRKLMAQELIETMKERGTLSDKGLVENVARFERQIEWARLTKSVRQVRVQVEGFRVNIDQNDVAEPVRIEAHVSLFNATAKPFNGALIVAADQEEGWKFDEPTVPINELEPFKHARQMVRARAESIKANIEGVMQVGILLGDDAGRITRTNGRLCVLTSQRVKSPIVIDGKLEEWPLGTTNVAGDFVLVGALDVPKARESNPNRSSQLTTVFVCNNRDYLYIGFNCDDESLADRRISRSNYVRYDDLWPTGEDLVEVVLDPTNKVKHAGDLFHIVVKSNGAVVSERGVSCLGRVARCRRWPADVLAAIDDTSHRNRWTVEIRIPLAAFGEKAAVWGVNFARLNPRLGEYSSWSGARRYIYSPVSLGNMRLSP
jgi:hypothetical protein